MSRCFPYPPPGYLPPSRRNDNGPLINSIKLQKDKEKAKEERRKERNKKKRDKKQKREEQLKKTDDRFGQGKPNNEISQNLEKQTKSHGDDVSSDVTEEHKQPVCVAKLSYSSEESQNSDKRKRHESPASTIKTDGTILKIRLSSFKKKGPYAIDRKDVGPSTSGRIDPIGQSDFEFGQRQPCSIVKDVELSNHDMIVSKSSTRKISKAELVYKSLVQSWAPTTQRSEGYDEDEHNWLFSRKLQKRVISNTSCDVPCGLDSNLLPRAQLLPSVNDYALPYTVPF